MEAANKGRGKGVTNLFVRKAVYRAFLNLGSLRSTTCVTTLESPLYQVQVYVLTELQIIHRLMLVMMMEYDTLLVSELFGSHGASGVRHPTRHLKIPH